MSDRRNMIPTFYAIDYGTTNSLLAAANYEQASSPIPLDSKATQSTIMQSILYAGSRDQWLFGQEAINEYLEQPHRGRFFKSLKKFLPDPLFEKTKVFQDSFTLPDLIAKILRQMRFKANDYFQCDVKSVVIGCPALFSANQDYHELAMSRLRKAAELAGFETIDLCPEPVAASYQFRRDSAPEELILVADFGGGTSDFTVIKITPSQFSPTDVLALKGVSIAGDKYDSAIMKHQISPSLGANVNFKRPLDQNVSKFPKAFVNRLCSPPDLLLMSKKSVTNYIRETKQWLIDSQDEERLDQLLLLIEERLGYALFREIEQAKIALSQSDQTELFYQYHELIINERVQRQDFEEHSRSLSEAITQCMDETLKMASLKPSEINRVYVTGGTSNIPYLKNALAARFSNKINATDNFHSVVSGLALRAQQIAG